MNLKIKYIFNSNNISKWNDLKYNKIYLNE